MKKLSLLLILALLLGLFAGCGSEPVPAPATTSSQQTEAPAETKGADSTTPVQQTETPAETKGGDADPSEVHPMLFLVRDADGHEMYLFGTIHAGDDRMDAALSRVASYVDSSDALAVEFDIVAYEADTQAQMRDMTQFVYTDGTTVEDHMPAELFARASELLNQANLPAGLLKAYNLSMWAQLVEQAAMMLTSDLDFENGMDRRLIQHCYDKKIEVRDVESPELQYGLLAGFSDELNLLLIKSTLDNLDSYGENLNALFETWTRGNYDEILAFLEQEDAEQESEFTEEEIALLEDYNDQMLTQRNLGMRDRALEWLKAGDKVFFAVGTAHLVGEDGLVELLWAAGCTVEQVEYR